jgi:hypothetical protein
MVPTYPTLNTSYMDGIVSTTMELFNKRADVEYYEIGVFDSEWKPIPFVSSYKIVKLEYLDHLKFEVFLRAADKSRAVYICSRSMIKKDGSTKTAVSSRICSKFRN